MIILVVTFPYYYERTYGFIPSSIDSIIDDGNVLSDTNTTKEEQ